MSDHFFVSSVALKKAHDGSWFVSKLFTSVGNFDLGQEVSKDLDKIKLETTIDDIRNKIFPQVEGFIHEEVSEEEKRKQEKK